MTNPSRRTAIFGVVTGLVATAVGSTDIDASLPTQSSSPKGSLNCEAGTIPVRCPKNGIISSISSIAIKSGDIVESDLICQVAFDDEALSIDRLRVAQALLEIDARVLSEDHVKNRRRTVEIAIEITNAYVRYAQSKYERDKVENDLGVTSDLLLLQSATAVAKAKAEKEKAEIALKMFDFNLQVMRERHELVKAQMIEEIKFVIGKRDQLKICAPKSGKIRLLVGVGSFVSMGQSIADIY
jgi:hypothetical protein